MFAETAALRGSAIRIAVAEGSTTKILGYRSRIMAEIEAGPEADFQDATMQALAELRASGIHLGRSQHPVHKRRKNVIVPDAYRTKASVAVGDQTPKAFSSSTVRA